MKMQALLLFFVSVAFGQTPTQVNGQQLKNLVISPISAVERFHCVGSGTGTNPDGSTYKWDCGGMQMIRLVLVDGTLLGPYVAVPADPKIVADPKWQRVPLAAPDPLPKATQKKN